MKKYLLLSFFLFFSASIFAQSYYYTYTAGKSKFAAVVKYNKAPKSGEKKWEVTVFDVYGRTKTLTDSTNDPLDKYPFLASSIIKIDKAKMGSVLFKDPNREVILQDIYNKFSAEVAKGNPSQAVNTPSTTQESNNATTPSNVATPPQTNEDSGSAKTEPVKPDTFICHISYADTSIFNLSVTKEKDITTLQLCKDPKKGDGDCISERVVDVDETSFNDRVITMIQKLTGAESIDTPKIKPPNTYNKYKKDEAAKQVKEKNEFEKAFENFKADHDKEEITYSRVGDMKLKDSVVIVYDIRDKPVKKIKIDSVKFSIEMGKLSAKSLRVYAANEIFDNAKAPVSALRIKRKQYNKLWNFDDSLYLRLGNVLEYDPDSWYVPDDVNSLLLTPEKRTQPLSAASNLNSLINFSLYTDLAGLLGRRANGLINTDVTSRFITNTGNFSNRDITPFSFIEGSVSLSKFDSKFKSMDSTTILAGPYKMDTVERMQLMQTAWLKGGVKFNLVSYRFSRSQYLQINIGTRINIVNADSFYRKERDIIMFDYYPEFTYTVHRLKNFGMDISIKWIFQRIADKEKFVNKEWEYIFNPQIAFFYFPTDNPNRKIYLRFNYFANRKKDANNFYQLQFGIKSDLKFGSKK